jgi:hypothetical protein
MGATLWVFGENKHVQKDYDSDINREPLRCREVLKAFLKFKGLEDQESKSSLYNWLSVRDLFIDTFNDPIDLDNSKFFIHDKENKEKPYSVMIKDEILDKLNGPNFTDEGIEIFFRSLTKYCDLKSINAKTDSPTKYVREMCFIPRGK